MRRDEIETSKIMSVGRNNTSRRQHFHSYSRGVRNHWRPRTGGTNIGAQGFRHTHGGRRHGHDFSSAVQRHWGANPGGYSVHHEGYYHSHNSPHDVGWIHPETGELFTTLQDCVRLSGTVFAEECGKRLKITHGMWH